MNKDQIYEVSFQIIMNSGEARSMAMESIAEAKKGNIENARNLLTQAREEINKAHKYQTDLIQAEANGEENDINVLLIHSQDHLMTAMVILDLAGEFIDVYETIKR